MRLGFDASFDASDNIALAKVPTPVRAVHDEIFTQAKELYGKGKPGLPPAIFVRLAGNPGAAVCLTSPEAMMKQDVGHKLTHAIITALAEDEAIESVSHVTQAVKRTVPAFPLGFVAAIAEYPWQVLKSIVMSFFPKSVVMINTVYRGQTYATAHRTRGRKVLPTNEVMTERFKPHPMAEQIDRDGLKKLIAEMQGNASGSSTLTLH